MKWCSCEQRPPVPGSDFCLVCRKKMREQTQDQGGEASKEGYAETENGAAVIAVGCLSLTLAIGVVLGWLVRGAFGS